MKDKPLYIVWVCCAVVFLVQLAGSMGLAQGAAPLGIDPFVYLSDPNKNQTDIPVSKVITITFTAPMDPNSTTDAFYFYAEGTDPELDNLKEEENMDINNNILVFDPSFDLQLGTTYWIKIKSTAMDEDGHHLDGDMDGTGGEAGDDDWKIRFTTEGQNTPPPEGKHWSSIYSQSQGDLLGKVSCLAVDSRDRLWIVTKDVSSIYCFDGSTFEDKTPMLPYQISDFPCITIDSQDRVWVGLDMNEPSEPDIPRLAKWENDAWQTITAQALDLGSNSAIIKIAADSQNDIWIATNDGFVFEFCGDQVVNYPPIQDLPADSITSLTVDHEDNVWVGTTFFGVYQMASGANTWKEYSYAIPLARNRSLGNVNYNIMDMSADSDGRLWIGTSNGLLKLEPGVGLSGTWTHYAHDDDTAPMDPNSIPGNFVTALAVSQDSGIVWTGTTDGLGRFDVEKNTWKNFAAEDTNTLSTQRIKAVAINSRGEVWIGTDDGLVMRDEVSPYVVAQECYPANHARVDTSVKIRITFSEPMKIEKTRSAFTLKDNNQNTIEGTFSWSSDKRTMEFTPIQSAVKTNQTYIISMKTSAVDLAGNPLSEEYKVYFSTSNSQSVAGSGVDLSGSGCFINASGTQARSWLWRIIKSVF
ncbi:MAG: Ig-like domain-containing protein [bacterium]